MPQLSFASLFPSISTPLAKGELFWQHGYARFTVNTLKLGASAFQINCSYADDKQVKDKKL